MEQATLGRIPLGLGSFGKNSKASVDAGWISQNSFIGIGGNSFRRRLYCLGFLQERVGLVRISSEVGGIGQECQGEWEDWT